MSSAFVISIVIVWNIRHPIEHFVKYTHFSYIIMEIMATNSPNKTVIVAMSGGVDSSVAAALLVEQGYNVIGVTMKTYSFDEVGGNIGNETSCCGLDAFNDARIVAVKLGIPHYVVDFTAEFSEYVVDNFVDEYLKGRTPNPCVICNKAIKWGALLRKADALGASHIATGHYARIEQDPVSGRCVIRRPRDANKDQTYALWGLDQNALRRTKFPLGELSKPEVRELAARHGLKTAYKEESFEICFVADNDYRRFIAERKPEFGRNLEGGAVLLDGKRVGTHAGFPNFTIGQRSGLGAFGERMYVTGIEPSTNSISIGKWDNLFRSKLVAKNMNLISGGTLPEGFRVHAQVRYKDTPEPASLSASTDGTVTVTFDQLKRAITPGQSIVLYDGDILLGGGIIDSVIE